MSRPRIESAHLLPRPASVRIADTIWRLHQRWEDVVFLHWPVLPGHLRADVPATLAIDTYDGHAWISVSALRISQMHLRHLPPLPGASKFAEINVRTYVRGVDGRAAVYFLSLDAGSRLAVEAARFAYALPYFRATVAHEWTGACLATRAERRDRRGTPATFSAEYCVPQAIHGEPHGVADPLTDWLLERYHLISARNGQLLSTDVTHRPWAPRLAQVSVSDNTLGRALGYDLNRPPASAHYAGVMDASIGPPLLMAGGSRVVEDMHIRTPGDVRW
jgi:uncharacterized protein YqjF (DUF2071 family)